MEPTYANPEKSNIKPSEQGTVCGVVIVVGEQEFLPLPGSGTEAHKAKLQQDLTL